MAFYVGEGRRVSLHPLERKGITFRDTFNFELAFLGDRKMCHTPLGEHKTICLLFILLGQGNNFIDLIVLVITDLIGHLIAIESILCRGANNFPQT